MSDGIKINAAPLEFKVLRTLCSKKISESIRMQTLGVLDENKFSVEFVVEALRRIKNTIERDGELPVWRDVLDDVGLSIDCRETLEEEARSACKTSKQLTNTVKQLTEYAKRRDFINLLQSTMHTMSNSADETFKIDEEIAAFGEGYSGLIRGDSEFSESLVELGDTSKRNTESIKEHVHTVLHKPTEVIYKTGFETYDAANGGLPTSGAMLMAATTSGGKSVTSMNLGLYMYILNKIRVCRVSLEMTKEQETKRLMSRCSGIPFWKIKQNKLSKAEKSQIEKAMLLFHKSSKIQDPPRDIDPETTPKPKEKPVFAYYTPPESVTIDVLLATLRPRKYDIIMIDYVGLLEGVDDDSQWMHLSSILKKCKNYGRANNCLVIVLAQLDDQSSRLRYSQGMREHVDVFWKWNYSDPEVRETKKLPVETAKARDGELIDFGLDEAFEIMKVTGRDGEAVARRQEALGPNNSFGDDDDDDEDLPKRRKRKKRSTGSSDKKRSSKETKKRRKEPTETKRKKRKRKSSEQSVSRDTKYALH